MFDSEAAFGAARVTPGESIGDSVLTFGEGIYWFLTVRAGHQYRAGAREML